MADEEEENIQLFRPEAELAGISTFMMFHLNPLS